MDTVLGLVGIVIFIPCVIAIAAAITWLAVKIFPASKPASEQVETPTPSSS